jgi:hypothetical protein
MYRLARCCPNCLCLLLLTTLSAAAQTQSSPVEQASSLLAQGQFVRAIDALEAALPTTPANERPRLIAKLRECYEQAIKTATANGNSTEVEIYTENLKILNRKPGPPHPAAEPAPVSEQVAAATRNSLPLPASEPPKNRELLATLPVGNARAGADPLEQSNITEAKPTTTRPGTAGSGDPRRTVGGPRRSADAETAGVGTGLTGDPLAAGSGDPHRTVGDPHRIVEDPRQAADDILVAADKAYREERYAEAGRLYAKLAASKMLPTTRNEALVYCRVLEIRARVYVGPKSEAEWAAIRREIQELKQIRRSPKNWTPEYLESLVAERSAQNRKPSTRKVTFRGASPDEESPAAANDRPSAVAPPRRITAPPAPPPAPLTAAEKIGQPGAPINSWHVWDTPNFRILHANDALAEKVARVCETTRSAQMKHWLGRVPAGSWTPRCDVYLYPTPEQFHKMTDQPEDSPGFSTMGTNGGRVVARRMNLRADHPKLLSAILPHEITHVLLADLFPDEQIPRWADEGMAVLSEPVGEQHLRAAELTGPLETGRLFRLQDLMVMDYPDGRFWGLYYAQSVSVTKFIVSRGTPAQFIQFVRESQKNSVESALSRVYQINGFNDLEKQWRRHAASTTTALAAVGSDGKAANGK